MRTNLFAASALATLLLAPWAATSAAAQCCDDHAMPATAAAPMDHSQHGAAAPAAMPCCADHAPAVAPAAAMACCADHKMAPAKAAMACCDGSDATIAIAALGLPEKPAVQTLAVTFLNPVRVGTVVLMGKYLIEHDDARMARGEPCTYIYNADDRRLPVVTFHCTHLERPATDEATVVLRPTPQYPVQELREFQFAGDEAGHGVPAIR